MTISQGILIALAMALNVAAFLIARSARAHRVRAEAAAQRAVEAAERSRQARRHA